MLTSTIPMQEGTREVVLPACCSISRMPCWRVQRGRCRATGGRVGGGSGAGRWVGVVASAAGPAERGGGGGTAGAAADRPGRLHRRGVLPGAGQTVLDSGDFLSDRALLADPATTALRRERTAECVQICGSVAVLGRGRSGSGDQGRGDQQGAAEPGLGGGDGRRWSARRDRVVHHGPGIWAVRADRVRVGRPDLPAQHERQVGDCPGCSVQAGLYLLTNVSDELGPVGVVRFVSPFHYFNASRALVPDHGPDLAATPRAHVRRCRHHRRGDVRAGDRALAVGAHLDPLGLIRVFTDVLLFAAVFGAVAALVVAWLRGTAGGAGLAIFTAASYLLICLVPLFGWPEWVTRPSVFDAIGNPYLEIPAAGGITFLAALAKLGSLLAVGVAALSPKTA